MKKALLTATVQSHIAQFHKPLIRILKENGYEVHIAARNNLAEKNGLQIEGADVIYDLPFSRSPKSTDNIRAYKELKKILQENQYEMIQCNTPVGGVVTRLVARKARKKGTKVYYTAHGFHFYKGAPIKNWLIYYPIEKYLARYTDKLVTINQEDYQCAQKHFQTDVYHIHGVGADGSRYNTEQAEDSLREELGYTKDVFLVLCTGELNQNKNQKTLISAISKLPQKAIKVVLAGNGANEADLRSMIANLQLEDRVKLVGYRVDLERFVKISDLVVSMSIREGLGLNIIEGMLCEKPVIGAYNRGHKDLIEEDMGGYMVNAQDADTLAEQIERLYLDAELRKQMGTYNQEKAQAFLAENVAEELRKIYELDI
ncbi:MAG: glycosyltransferase family 4 protein [Clostridia bacterium]|nr:glycosyltransferase family 4 protein [Clostridia bacterium]